jgi:hypothetical protein
MQVANSESNEQERQRTQALLDIANALKKIAISASEIQKDLKAIASKR